ncbi:MAG: ion transporter [Lachnospiraceae bacterium]|nr:ion transporter [Lachnospiraceae bacterium]
MNAYTQLKRNICNIIRDDGQKSLANRIFSNTITALIIINITMVLLELAGDFSAETISIFYYAEAVAVIIFTLEYLLRLWTADLLYPGVSKTKARCRYIFSPMSLIDLVAIVPFYMAFIPFNTAVIRILRLLRLLRIFKMSRYSEAKTSEKILASINEAIIITDAESNLLSANNAAQDLFPALKDTKKYTHLGQAENFPAELLDFDGNLESYKFSLSEDTFYSADISRLYDREKLLRFIIIIHDITASVLLERAEKERIKNLFGRFVAADVVDEMIAGNISVDLGGVLKEVTLLFVDIRGFTAFSEANPPEKVVEMVNRYLNLTSRSIQEFGGTIDKYIGDATMAVFNAPNDLENHSLCAVKAAWAMKQGSITLKEEILRDFGVDLQFGIGINCGEAIVGNMGSDFRMDYTVIGDTVNTAARLESNAGKGQIIISEAVYKLVCDDILAEDRGILTVKNKKDGIHVYEVVGLKNG